MAAGGDPAAVTAALDSRIAAVVPFNFGEATPRDGGRNGRWAAGPRRPGLGTWESTRNLPGSIVGQLFPVGDRRVRSRRAVFVYSIEPTMGWRGGAASRRGNAIEKMFGFYDATDRLAEAHGLGEFPGPGECANIGPSQRRTLYPTFQKWFGIPIPASEPDDRRPEDELASLTPEIASQIGMRSQHDLAREAAVAKAECGSSGSG